MSLRVSLSLLLALAACQAAVARAPSAPLSEPSGLAEVSLLAKGME